MANMPFREPDITERLSELGTYQAPKLTLNWDHLPLCSEAATFLLWLEEVVGAALRNPSYERLDKAIAAVSKEMLHRKTGVQEHTWPHSCISDVFNSWLTDIVAKQQELVRHRFLDPEPPELSAPDALRISIGTEIPTDDAET